MLTHERFLKVTEAGTVALTSPFLDPGKHGAKMKHWVWLKDEPEDATWDEVPGALPD